jgi:hypothetical protein
MLSASMSGAFAFLGDISPVLLAIGLYGLVNAILVWKRGVRVAGWPTIPGVITDARVKKGKSGAGDMGHGNSPKTTIYRAAIRYAYEVDGVRLQGTRVQFGEAKHERVKSTAQDAAAQYSPGQAVQVRYDPQRPGESALEPGVAPFWKTRVVFAVTMLALGACAWLAAAAAR